MNSGAWVKVQDLDIKKALQMNLDKRADLPDTGGWVFAKAKVQSWAYSEPDAVQALWIKAHAGFGKSVLSSYIVTEMQSLHPTGVAYFFCKHDDDKQRSIVSILRTWIWQLIKKQTIGGEIVDSHLTILPETVVDFENRMVSGVPGYSVLRIEAVQGNHHDYNARYRVS